MTSESITYKTPDQIRRMRAAGLVVADVLDAVRAAIRPGTTTGELDAVAAAAIEEAGATSSFLGYHGYPAVICASVNDEVVHGIPGRRVLEPGDVVSVDAGAIVDGWHGDSAFTTVLDEADPADVALSTTTEQAMWAGIAALARGRHLGVVGSAVESVVNEASAPYAIIREYVGHGIGTQMHEAPEVPHHRLRRPGPKLRPGLVVAVEPMLVRGRRYTKTLADDWTVVTTDGSRAAHWEHTVAIHDGGIWVLTARDGGMAGLAPFGVTPAEPSYRRPDF